MKSHGKEFIGSIQVKSVGSVPSSGAEGELVYNTGDSNLYVADGSTFAAVGGSSGSPIKTHDPFGDDVLHIIVGTLYMNMQLHGGVAKLRLSAYDAIISIQGGVGTFTYAISKDDSNWTSNTDPKLAYVEYTVADSVPGAVQFYVKVTDSDTPAQETKTAGALVVQDNYGLTGV